MSHSTMQFITQMKLRELRRQRSKLGDAYENLGAEVAAAREPGDRLRTLYDGLRGLNFAGRPLHSDVVNLEVLLHEIEAGTASPEVLALWLRRLEQELETGRARSEVIYLFGILLEEWVRGEASGESHLGDAQQVRDQLLGEALLDARPNAHREVLDPLFDDLGSAVSGIANRLGEACRDEVAKSVVTIEIQTVLERLAADIYRPSELRGEARRFAKTPDLTKELADALTILIDELSSWDWSREGLETRALWTRNKWRLYLDEDLPTACLLEVLGDRWVEIFDRLTGDAESQIIERRTRLQQLLKLGAPEAVVTNERRMLRLAEQMVSLGAPEISDPWGDDQGLSLATMPESGSVVQKRAKHQASLRNFRGAGDGYEGGYGEINNAVLLVHAEVQLARAVYPDRPLFVVKTDLRNFYSSIPHDVVLEVLRRLGMPEAPLAVFARYLAPPLRQRDGAPMRTRHGVPMGHGLSGMLAELLMRLLERHVRKRTRVRIVRIVDDICFLTPDADAAIAAWEGVETFCVACGLKVNLEKSGALGLGGERPARLPAGRPRWGMLELDERGQWNVHQETFDAHLEQSRIRVEAAPSVLSKVQVYNANLKYLLNALVLGGRLGAAHRESAGRAVARYHLAFSSAGLGITTELRAEIGARLQGDPVAGSMVAEGWLYWPVTAGGLGLRNPLVVVAQYAAGDRDRRAEPAPGVRPADWELRDNEWASFYAQFLEPIAPLAPEETKVMKTLVNDFIARGAEISSGQQTELAPYWRWILCTYGPQIIQRFGTFRFLTTELVPLQLISRQHSHDASLD